MENLKGLYIEDENKNIDMLRALFSFCEGIEIEGVASAFPQNAEDFVSIIKEKDIDFVIVDHELEKMVTYKGIDALKAIRTYDENIYAILLTNYPLTDYKDELGNYDFQLTKEELREPGKVQELVAKIKRACELRADNRVLAAMSAKHEEQKQLLEELKKICDGR